MFELYEVGGCVRDEILGIASDDVDYSVVPRKGEFREAEEARVAFRETFLEAQGFEIFEEREEFFTFRCLVPAESILRERTKIADFVMARIEGPYSDNRRPDFVLPGTLDDDLSRRDFTINAIAKVPFTGEIIDPHGGVRDLEARTLRFVGNPMDRIQEDGLRILRAIRFAAVYDLTIPEEDYEALTSDEAVACLLRQKVDRIFMEMNKLFTRASAYTATNWIGSLPPNMVEAIFRGNLRLAPTLKAAKRL